MDEIQNDGLQAHQSILVVARLLARRDARPCKCQQMSFAGFAALVCMFRFISLADLEESDIASISSVGFECGQQAGRNTTANLGFALNDGIDHRDMRLIEISELLEQSVRDEGIREVLVEAGPAR